MALPYMDNVFCRTLWRCPGGMSEGKSSSPGIGSGIGSDSEVELSPIDDEESVLLEVSLDVLVEESVVLVVELVAVVKLVLFFELVGAGFI